jgi:putative NADPH-quinone reductase
MRITVLLAHPTPGSFNHAIADTVVDQLRRLGHEPTLHDLYAEQFDPLLTTAEISGKADLPPAIARHCEEISAADGIVIVHPNWWGQPPAVLKGWVDRVLRMGIAYRFAATDSGEGVPIGLLRARSALVLNTSNTPPAREAEVFGDPLERLWRDCILQFCGVPRIVRETFSVIVTSTPAQRQQWLERTRVLVTTTFPAAR